LPTILPAILEKPTDIVRRVEAEGPSAFEPVVRAMSPRLFRLALRILGRASDAEDAVQDAFVRAYDAMTLGRYDETLRMDAWLVRIVTRASIDCLRSRKVREPAGAETELAELAAAGLGEEHANATLELSAWLACLAPDQRAAVVLKFMEGMTSAEVAATLEISEGAVEQRILRARATLRKRMGSDVDA
jgi:RNA polymerase sigma-70 factor, ECF subfamily